MSSDWKFSNPSEFFVNFILVLDYYMIINIIIQVFVKIRVQYNRLKVMNVVCGRFSLWINPKTESVMVFQ